MSDVRGKFFVPGPIPGWNEAFAAANANRYKGNTLKKKWTDAVAWHVKAAKIPKMDQAYFIFTWCEKKRNRDPDNIASSKKYVLDGLVLAGVLENDGWHQILGWEDTFLVGKPGVNVEIRGLMR